MVNLLGVTDKRRGATNPDHRTTGADLFTANAGGTTTTMVGANAAPGTNDNNVVRRGEKFRLFNSQGLLKEEKVFRVTGIAVGASTTITFTPAAAVATANGDIAKLVSFDDYQDEESMDRRLTAISSTTYTADRLRMMNYNDKVFALRSHEAGGGF